jgi:hypothetical protein
MKKLTFSLAVILFASCEKELFNESYEFMYGDWVPVQLSAGMNYDARPELLGDLIQILRNGSYNLIRNDRAVETGEISIEKQTENELSIKFVTKKPYFGSESFIRLPHYTLNVTARSRDSVFFYNNAVDGGHFGLLLKRK